MEVDTHIKTDMNIIFGYNISNWTIESNSIPRNGNNWTFASWIATSQPRFHETCILSPVLFKNHHTSWDILQTGTPSAWHAASTRWLVKNNNNWNLLITMSL